jgi:hypothetical protein
MAERVFFHIGVPKTGTTYVQTTMWRHAGRLRDEGVLLPGDGHAYHRWGSLVVREDPKLAGRDPAARGSWDGIVAEVKAWPGTAVISHEFYASATAAQAQHAVDALAPAEVHLVVTARDPLSLLTASWQEALKWRCVTPLDDFNRHVSSSPHDIWNWRGLDVAEVLSRWGPTVSADRVHVIPLPRRRTTERDLWDRFAGLFSGDPAAYDVRDAVRNASMGLVECELMRLVSPHLSDLPTAGSVSRWVRGYVAENKLVPRSGERFHPSPHRIQECRDRAEQMVARLQAGGYHVIGDLEDLLVPAELPQLRTPADVSADEVAGAAAALVAEILRDLRSTELALRSRDAQGHRLRLAALSRSVRRAAHGGRPRYESTRRLAKNLRGLVARPVFVGPQSR